MRNSQSTALFILLRHVYDGKSVCFCLLTLLAKGCPCSVLVWYLCVYVVIEAKGSHRTCPTLAVSLTAIHQDGCFVSSSWI